jgi:hypothetical protein
MAFFGFVGQMGGAMSYIPLVLNMKCDLGSQAPLPIRMDGQWVRPPIQAEQLE